MRAAVDDAPRHCRRSLRDPWASLRPLLDWPARTPRIDSCVGCAATWSGDHRRCQAFRTTAVDLATDASSVGNAVDRVGEKVPLSRRRAAVGLRRHFLGTIRAEIPVWTDISSQRTAVVPRKCWRFHVAATNLIFYPARHDLAV